MILELENIHKKFGKNTALKNINLSINKHETVCIIGPSGSGKTTLIRCINKLEEPSSGIVRINGKEITKKNHKKLTSKIGMVFQHFNLFPHFTILDNLTYPAIQISKMKKNKAEEKALDLLEKFGIKNKADLMPSSLSGGQKQRAAIARCLMMDPELILFDEPTSALDPEVIREITNTINDLKQNTTMVIVSHHVKFAKNIADRIVFMDQGMILDDLPVDKFFEKPKSQRARLFLRNTEGYI